MATKIIKMESVTLQGPHPDFQPLTWDEDGTPISGNMLSIVYPPGTLVVVEAHEADAILARHRGVVVDVSPHEVSQAVIDAELIDPNEDTGEPADGVGELELADVVTEAKSPPVVSAAPRRARR